MPSELANTSVDLDSTTGTFQVAGGVNLLPLGSFNVSGGVTNGQTFSLTGNATAKMIPNMAEYTANITLAATAGMVTLNHNGQFKVIGSTSTVSGSAQLAGGQITSLNIKTTNSTGLTLMGKSLGNTGASETYKYAAGKSSMSVDGKLDFSGGITMSGTIDSAGNDELTGRTARVKSLRRKSAVNRLLLGSKNKPSTLWTRVLRGPPKKWGAGYFSCDLFDECVFFNNFGGRREWTHVPRVQPTRRCIQESSTQETLLQRAREFVERSEPQVDLSGTLFLTKQQFFSRFILHREFALEEAAHERLGLHLPLEILCHRYHERLGGAARVPTLRHYATRLVGECPRLRSLVNPFMFFPHVSGIVSAAKEDAFSFEFVETWEPILGDCVLPCVDRAFTPSAAQRIRHNMGANFQEVGYFYSLFHEIGHHYGAFRILGGRDPDIVLSDYLMNIMGELATDVSAALLAPEFPELGLITLLYRSFWFGQWGFESTKGLAKVAPDHDAWTGVYLWQKAEEVGVIHGKPGQLEFEDSALGALYETILSELDLLSNDLRTQSPSAQAATVREWMCRSLTQDTNGAFLLPQSMRDAFVKCQGIPRLRSADSDSRIHG